MVAVQEDLGIEFLHGPFYPPLFPHPGPVSACCAWSAWPVSPGAVTCADPTAWTNRREDLIVLVWFIAVLLSGFVVEGARIGGTELQTAPRLGPCGRRWGALVALAFAALGVSESTFLFWHRVWWWTHMVITFGFLTYIGFFQAQPPHLLPAQLVSPQGPRQRRTGAPSPIWTRPLEGDEEALASVRFGAASLADFTWKQLMDLDACTRCGRCQDNCPAWLSGKPLSPKFVILDLQQHMNATAGGRPARRRTLP